MREWEECCCRREKIDMWPNDPVNWINAWLEMAIRRFNSSTCSCSQWKCCDTHEKKVCDDSSAVNSGDRERHRVSCQHVCGRLSDWARSIVKAESAVSKSERLNATQFCEFKQLASSLASEYRVCIGMLWKLKIRRSNGSTVCSSHRTSAYDTRFESIFFYRSFSVYIYTRAR